MVKKKKSNDLHSHIVKHLKGDIKMYGDEAKEDRDLIKKVMKSSKKKQNMEDRYREHSGEERAKHGYHKSKNPRKSFERFVEKEDRKNKPKMKKKK